MQATRSFLRRFGPRLALGALLTLPPAGLAQTPPEAINPGTPWPATDALGRALPETPPAGGLRANRCVGIFYFLWHEKLTDTLPNDLSRILAQDPQILSKPDSPLWGPPSPYYWGQPLYGYYNSTDPWVLRRHANLLADAGIDTVIFDATNRLTYRAVYLKLCEVWTQVRREGGRTPQICFMVNTKAGDTARELFHDLYQPGLYPDLWFRWQGKPLLISDFKEAGPELAAFFTLRKAHWPFTLVNTPNETPKEAPLQRRQALAMIAAMDEGIGRIRAKLHAAGLEKNTLIFFIGDNGAPLKEGAWDGSLNLPLTGEKGMLTDGGIRTPFVAAWPGTIPSGQVFDAPVINLDVAATAVALAGQPHDEKLDGVNLMPFLLGEKKGAPHEALYWRWRSQAAVRADHWKLILLGRNERFLFDLDSPEGETKTAWADFPEIATDLDKKLMAWNAQLPPPGLPHDIVDQDQMFYDAHVLKTGVTATKSARKGPAGKNAKPAGDWVARNATTVVQDGALRVTPEGRQKPFLAFAGLNIAAPAVATVSVRSEKGGTVGVAWRLQGQSDFSANQMVSQQLAASPAFQNVTLPVTAKGALIHLRVMLPEGSSDLRGFEIKDSEGKTAKQWNFAAQP